MLKKAVKKPILLTGAPRSGTTFVGRMLDLSSSIGYFHEPFNVQFGIEGIHENFIYIYEGMENEKYYENLLCDLLKGKAKYKRAPLDVVNQDKPLFIKARNYLGRAIIKSKPNVNYYKVKLTPSIERYFLKDPIACMSSEWLHRKFNMDVVILLRHPAAFVSSLKRLNWRFDFRHLLNQPDLLREHPEILEIIKDYDVKNLSIVEEGALWWTSIYTVLFKYLDRNPNMIAFRHEDISNDPFEKFKELYEHLGMDYTPQIQEKIKDFTDNSNPTIAEKNKVHVLKRNSKENTKVWKKKLSSEEIRLIKEITEPVAKRYYSEIDW
ncbi:sulfotransferase [Bacillus taeanensis]|uniref:Sulfotransferase domain-containing protein n=1 Tax=Bacillus taeanensis TaxID=273032 RepID=A0A366XXM0_9BACI|nr:sulfotransferase [Bacillus taeanensis]RBW68884.1 hypothetical protein DS031_14195 [Bacillus taeanensis]